MDKIISRMNILENSFNNWQRVETIQFDKTHDDLCSFVFYRYLQLCIERNKDDFTSDILENIISKYDDNIGTKTANFYRNNQLDYFWVKTQINFYNSIANDIIDLTDKFPVDLNCLKVYVEYLQNRQ